MVKIFLDFFLYNICKYLYDYKIKYEMNIYQRKEITNELLSVPVPLPYISN